MYGSSNLTLKKNEESSAYGGGDVSSLVGGDGNADGRADDKDLERIACGRPRP